MQEGGGGSGHLAKGHLFVPESGLISVNIGRGGGYGYNGGDTVVEAGEVSLTAEGGEAGSLGGGRGWSGGGGYGGIEGLSLIHI